MNTPLNLIIATLIALGILMTDADWNNLDNTQQELYKTTIIIDDISGY
jgi:hypothetical protein